MAKKFSELVFYPNAKKKGSPEESEGTVDMKNSTPAFTKEDKNSDQMDITHRSGRKEKVKVHMTGSDYHIVKNKDGAQYTVDKKGNVLHGHGNANEEVEIEEGKAGLWANIHAKRERIKNGSGERMRKPGSEGAPTKAALKASQTEGYSNYDNNRTGFAKRQREDDEYHVPDPVATKTHVVKLQVSKDGGEKHHRSVTISNSTKSSKEATASARAHLEKQGYKIHEEVISEDAYKDAEGHLDKADKAQRNKDMFSHHMHMADHHDSLSQWHDSKGRSDAAEKHANKAADHEERAHAIKQRLKEESELDESTPTSMQVKQGIGIARDKRYAGGNMTGAVAAMNKVNKGLAQHPAVKKELQKQNEDVELNESQAELNKHVSDFSKGVKSSAAKQSTYKRDGKPIHNMKHVETDSDHQKVFDHLKKMGYKKTSGYDPKPHEFSMSHNHDTMTTKSDPVHHSSGVSAHVEKEHGGKTKVHFTHRNIKEQAPVAPTLDRKYIKGTPENKALRASRKPINGHPTGQAKTDDSLRAYYASKKKTNEEVELDEKINLAASKMGDVIKDFQKSDAPQFAGKSAEKKRQMAIAAKLQADGETKKEETMLTFTSFVEALKGNQHKIDKNKNGKVDAQDFKMLQKEEVQIDEISDKTLDNYVSAARKDREQNKVNKSAPDAAQRANAQERDKKRIAGMNKANSYLTPGTAGHAKNQARRTANEEVELDEARVNGREYASQGVMHPDHAKMDIHKPSNQEVDFYASKTGDKMQGKVLKNDGKEVHIKAHKELGDGKLHKFKVTANLPKPQNEEVEIEENAFDWKSKKSDATSGRYEIKRVGGRTIVTRKYNPDTGMSTGTDDNEPAEKRGRGRPAGSKNRGSAK